MSQDILCNPALNLHESWRWYAYSSIARVTILCATFFDAKLRIGICTPGDSLPDKTVINSTQYCEVFERKDRLDKPVERSDTLAHRNTML